MQFGVVGLWSAANLIAVWVLARSFRGRPFSQRDPAARWVLLVLLMGWLGLCLAWAFADSHGSWRLVLIAFLAMAPIPVWVERRRPRYPAWGPTPRANAAASFALGLAAWTWPVARTVAQAHRLSAFLAIALTPLLISAAWPLLRRPVVPAFTARDRAQPWWPRTPGSYRDALHRRRLWDGSQWLDLPDDARKQRRALALTWTLACGHSWNALLLRDGGHSSGPLDGVLLVFTLGVAVVLALGTMIAWLWLDRPLAADASFPPTSRPEAVSGPVWMVDPDDGSLWRFWDGVRWTEQTMPGPPARDSTARVHQP